MAKALLANAPMRDMNKSSLGIKIASPAVNTSFAINDNLKVCDVPVIVMITDRKIDSLTNSYFTPSHLINGGSRKSIGT